MEILSLVENVPPMSVQQQIHVLHLVFALQDAVKNDVKALFVVLEPTVTKIQTSVFVIRSSLETQILYACHVRNK